MTGNHAGSFGSETTVAQTDRLISGLDCRINFFGSKITFRANQDQVILIGDNQIFKQIAMLFFAVGNEFLSIKRLYEPENFEVRIQVQI